MSGFSSATWSPAGGTGSVKLVALGSRDGLTGGIRDVLWASWDGSGAGARLKVCGEKSELKQVN